MKHKFVKNKEAKVTECEKGGVLKNENTGKTT